MLSVESNYDLSLEYPKMMITVTTVQMREVP